MPRQTPHPDRKEIARYLLSRGLERLEEPEPPPVPRARRTGAAAGPLLAASQPGAIPFPDGLAPVPEPVAHGDAEAPLPEADVVVITWTVNEVAALAKVMTPGFGAQRWQNYRRNFDHYQRRRSGRTRRR